MAPQVTDQAWQGSLAYASYLAPCEHGWVGEKSTDIQRHMGCYPLWDRMEGGSKKEDATLWSLPAHCALAHWTPHLHTSLNVFPEDPRSLIKVPKAYLLNSWVCDHVFFKKMNSSKRGLCGTCGRGTKLKWHGWLDPPSINWVCYMCGIHCSGTTVVISAILSPVDSPKV